MAENFKEANPDIGEPIPEIDELIKNQIQLANNDTKLPESNDTRPNTAPVPKGDTTIPDSEATEKATPTKVEIPSFGDLSDDEKKEVELIGKAIAAVQSALNEKDFDRADEVIEKAKSYLSMDQTKEQVAGLEELKSDIEFFWRVTTEFSGKLKGGHEIEMNDGAAVVVEASTEKIVIRFAGESISGRPDELPTGLAMKLVESALTDATSDFLRAKGSVYFVDSIVNAENRTKAGQFWQAANDDGASVDSLMWLLAE